MKPLKNKTSLRWTRSDNGYTDTHCGRFWIEPFFGYQFIQSKRPKYYKLFELEPIMLHHIRHGRFDRQAEAKAHAESIANAGVTA